MVNFSGNTVSKDELLSYYRKIAEDIIKDTEKHFSKVQYRQKAVVVNRALIASKKEVIEEMLKVAGKEKWAAEDKLSAVLMITYTNYVVMMETRNDVWPYEYMAFARRIGELWEPFCQLCWEYPVKSGLSYYKPPVYSEVREELQQKINDFVQSLSISKKEKDTLLEHYEVISSLVSSGEINLSLDLHFETKNNKYAVDFKSGFSSNEKGNTNRLLLVANIYKSLSEDYECLLFVRSNEETNNHYLQTLKKSNLWTVYCGKETYKIINTHTGFDLASWMSKNIDWSNDFDKKMYQHLKNNELLQYLEW